MNEERPRKHIDPQASLGMCISDDEPAKIPTVMCSHLVPARWNDRSKSTVARPMKSTAKLPEIRALKQKNKTRRPIQEQLVSPDGFTQRAKTPCPTH